MCPLSARVAITATRCVQHQLMRIRKSNTSDSCNLLWGGIEKGVVSITREIGEPGSPRRTWVVFSPWTRCAVSWSSCFFEGHSFRFLGKAFGLYQGGNRKRSSWMDLFVSLDNLNANAFRPQATASLSLFQNFFVTHALLSEFVDFTVDKCRRSTGGGTSLERRRTCLWSLDKIFSTLKLPCRRACEPVK